MELDWHLWTINGLIDLWDQGSYKWSHIQSQSNTPMILTVSRYSTICWELTNSVSCSTNCQFSSVVFLFTAWLPSSCHSHPWCVWCCFVLPLCIYLSPILATSFIWATATHVYPNWWVVACVSLFINGPRFIMSYFTPGSLHENHFTGFPQLLSQCVCVYVCLRHCVYAYRKNANLGKDWINKKHS